MKKTIMARKLNDLGIIDCSVFIINRFLNQGTNYNNQGTNYKLESKKEWKESIQGKQKRNISKSALNLMKMSWLGQRPVSMGRAGWANGLLAWVLVIFYTPPQIDVVRQKTSIC